MQTKADKLSTDAGRDIHYDVQRVRRDFPILERTIHGKPLVYLDTAASAQRPQQVLQAVQDFYCQHNANIHRGVHLLSEEATDRYESARAMLADHIGAASEREIVFTRGTTESVNLVAQSFLRPRLQSGDEIVITHMEHHSNIVPWQLLCEQTGAVLKVAPVNDAGELILDELRPLLTERVKMLALVHISNALGTINPVRKICQWAASQGIPVLLDGAQALPHQQVDMAELGCDFYCFSGHKMYGPTGIGVLWARQALLESMPPYQGGGEMIRFVSFAGTEYNDVPHKFEAGTPNIAGAVGLGAAVRYLQQLGLQRIAEYEQGLLQYATEAMQSIDGLRIIGQAQHKASVISFIIEGVHAHDLGTLIDHYGVAVRTGHHCTMPLMQRFDLAATARVSLGLYNTRDEIDRLVSAIRKVQGMFA